MRISDWSSDVFSSDLKGQDIKAVLELGRFPGIVLAVKKEHQGKVKSAADLKGMKIGVTAPGSSTNFFVNYLIAKAGGNYKDSAFIGVGGGASGVAAIQKGEIDAISHLDPVITKLQNDGSVFILHDSRTERSDEHTSELQSLMRISYAVCCLQK